MDFLMNLLYFSAGAAAALFGVVFGVRIFKNREAPGALFSSSPKIDQDEVD